VSDLAPPVRRQLGDSAWLLHFRRWLSEPDASRLMQRLRNECVWEQRSIRLFGREVAQPRLIASGGSETYRYSGVTLPRQPMPAPVTELATRVHETLDREPSAQGWRANHALLNRYRNGSDSMGWHSDDERELGTNPLIVSVSVGAARRLDFAPRRSRSRQDSNARAKTYLKLLLEHGDLLIMGGTTQHEWRHAIPKERAATEERISVTFRRIER